MQVRYCQVWNIVRTRPFLSTWQSPTQLYLTRCCSKGNTLRRRRFLRWGSVPLAAGCLYAAYHYHQPSTLSEDAYSNSSQSLGVKLYSALPLNVLSRVTGHVFGIQMPVLLRRPVYGLYVWLTGCNMTEAAIEDLQYYTSLAQLFRRRLKPQCRPIDQRSALVSPSDGRVLHLGVAENGLVEQVKGVNYALKDFLGPKTWHHIPCSGNESQSHDAVYKDYQKKLGLKPGNQLYHCVIYLAPGDYHGYHAPAEWSVKFRRHFPGDLLSVSPIVARWVRGLFCLNERAVYIGEWRYGFLAMAPVGATNVGSIKIYHDKDLHTNLPHKYPDGTHLDKYFSNEDSCGINFKKGEGFGEFNFGSTIVLLFEAPKDFAFTVSPGDQLQYGQALGFIQSLKSG